MFAELKGAFESADFPGTIRLIDRHFGEAAYSLKSLFKDEQRRILTDILESAREDLESRFRLIAERYTPLMKFLQTAHVPLPAGLEFITDTALHSDIRRQISAESLNLDRLRSLLTEARARSINVQSEEVGYAAKNRLEQLITRVQAEPENTELLMELENAAELLMPLAAPLKLWKVQNIYWDLMQGAYPSMNERAELGDEAARSWVEHFLKVGEQLGFANKAPTPAKVAEVMAA
jgi:hypothetical protein